ncbi:MAG: tyrosine-type recombinase/integrase [Methanobrevibacter sp.]|uniref:tyrosine-type recombinase/integrase n=1 Tax=Methanobrevibacter sp. TaxID=66852 RepID=UPI003F057C62
MKTMKTEDILHQVYSERRSSQSTQNSYNRAVTYFEKHVNKTLGEVITIAETEETNNISWKNSTLKPLLVSYRAYLFDKYQERTADLYFTALTTVFRHFEIQIGNLPYFSRKNINRAKKIKPGQLPDRELLKQVIELKNPLIKAFTLFVSSSGLSRIDALNLTVNDYLKATYPYHKSNDIYEAIVIMKESEVDIIPCFEDLVRQKTKKEYFTFCSHEAVNAINNYLMSRTDDYNKRSKLFKINERYLSKIFKEINDHLGLGTAGPYSRFAPHMLRRYHATQLAEAGLSGDLINLLEGRKVSGVLHESYIRIKPEVLKKEYIKALPFLVVEDVEQIRTELDVVKSEKEHLESENVELKKQYDETNKRMDNLEKLVLGGIDSEKLERLHKLL